jgi:hypothetical protein
MPEVRTAIESINFKQVPGGYVYRAPSHSMFRPARHYLAKETQKAEIVAILTPRRPSALGDFFASVFGVRLQRRAVVNGDAQAEASLFARKASQRRATASAAVSPAPS